MNIKRKTVIIGFFIVAAVLLAIVLAPYFIKEKPKENQSSSPSTEKTEVVKENKKNIDTLLGKCFSNNDNDIRTVLIFSDDADSKYNSFTTIRDYYSESPGVITEEYEITEDLKYIIIEPAGDNIKREFQLAKNYIIINGIKYKEDDINKYTN
ncbi:MAG: hypothetical protein ACRCUS_05020 [Anaerovoracaceae bacterium]